MSQTVNYQKHEWNMLQVVSISMLIQAPFRALFPCGDNFVCIVDDREEVWNFAPNLIHVKPYHFFQRTGDIHAPPGLEKKELDSPNGKSRIERLFSRSI